MYLFIGCIIGGLISLLIYSLTRPNKWDIIFSDERNQFRSNLNKLEIEVLKPKIKEN